MKKIMKRDRANNPEICEQLRRALDLIGLLSMDNRFKFLDSGRHRSVFLHINRGYVIKIAKNMDGIQANDDELRLFRKRACSSIPMARCRKLSDIAIVMEYVEIEEMPHSNKDLPNWILRVDGGQVGTTKSGKLVAYDYSII